MPDFDVSAEENSFGTGATMIVWLGSTDVYLHRDSVDFRKAINDSIGLHGDVAVR
jgi:hypothetical protein